MAHRTVWRERWRKYSAKSGSMASWTYRDSIFDIGHLSYEKPENEKNANHVGGASFVFDPSNRYLPFVKGPKEVISGGQMVDLGGQKLKTPHLRDWLFWQFFGFSQGRCPN